MKKNLRFLICMATATVTASCLNEKGLDNGPEVHLVPMTFSAVVDSVTVDSKTSLGTDFSVIWDEEESISLLSGTSHTEFSMVDRSDDGKTAVFEGLAEQTGVYYAVYPYSEDHSINDGIITVSLTDSQTATADGFADDVNLSVATSTSTDLQFRNVGALVGVTVDNDNIKSVILTATEEDSYLAGKATLQFTGGLPEVTVTEGCASVRLNGDFVKGYTYYFVVYPGSYTNLKITYVDVDGKIASKSNPNTLTLKRNGNATLGTIEMTEFYGYTAGEDLFIGGEGAEAGRKLLYVTEGYYNTDSPFNDVYKAIEEGDYGYYEIFTTLKAGKPYFFYTGTSDKRKLLIKGNALATVATEAEAAATVEADGVYRVRINPSNGQVGLATVTGLSLKRSFDSKKYQFEYAGNGTWQRLNHNAEHLSEYGGEARHFYVMTLQSLDGKTYSQGWSKQDGNNMKPTHEGQWDVPLFDYGDMKDGNDLDRWFCDAFVYMNADVEHYAREFTNKWEGLKIGGEGAESGQAFTMITPSSYYNTESNYADRIGTIDNNITYFEIFTKIEAGRPYYFYSDPLNTYYFKTDEFVNAADAEGASATVDETAVYRIRINLSTKEIGMEKVEKVMYDNGWRSDYYELAYAGRGVWKAEQHRVQLHRMADGRLDNRYKFQMFFQGQDTIQGLGGIDGASDGYWVQPTNAGNWDERLFFLPSTVADETIADRYSADVVLYMNNDKGHYTHEFVNVVDNQISGQLVQ